MMIDIEKVRKLIVERYGHLERYKSGDSLDWAADGYCAFLVGEGRPVTSLSGPHHPVSQWLTDGWVGALCDTRARMLLADVDYLKIAKIDRWYNSNLSHP
jgi:hypothetical protein